MKIKNLMVRDFRNISFAELELNQINYIFGKNNSGKSSLLAACNYAISNSSTFSSKLDELQKKEKEDDSADGSFVSVNIDGLGEIQRFRKKGKQSNKLNGVEVPDKEVLGELVTKFNCDYDVINLMFEGSRFTRMSPKEQKTFLLQLTGISINATKLIEYMDNPSELAKQKVIESLAEQSISIDDIEKYYKVFFGERKSEKKNKEILDKDLFAKKTLLPLEKPRLVEYIEKDIVSIEKTYQENIQKKTIHTERISKKNSLLSMIDAKKNEREKLMARLESTIVTITTIEELNQLLSEQSAEVNACIREQAAFESSKTNFETLREKLNTDKCPLTEKIICPVDKSPLLEDFDKNIKELEEKINKIKDKVAIANSIIKETNEKISLIREKKELVSKVDAISKDIEMFEKELNAIEIPDIDGVEKVLETLSSQLSNFKIEKSESLKYQSLLKDIEKCKNEVDKASIVVDTLEYLVKEFEPNGVRSRILKKIIEPLQEKATISLAKITDEYSIEFSMEEDFIINIKTSTGTIPFAQLSESEKLRVQIVIQDIINGLCGVGILVIDEAGILDKNNFLKLSLLLDNFKDSYNSIFVLATKEEDDAISFKTNIVDKEKSSIFFIENGRCKNI